MRLPLLFALLLASTAACTANSADVDDSQTDESDEAVAKKSVATLTFTTDFRETQVGTLVEGGRVRIRYSADRLPQCRGSLSNGKDAWTITGFASVNGGAAKSFWVAGYDANPTHSTALPELALDAPGNVAIWFQVSNAWGCSAWDSNLGKNYGFGVAAAPTSLGKLVFPSDPSVAPHVDGAARAGGKLEIDYVEARLPTCRATYGSAQAWTITGFASANGGPAKSFYVAGHASDPSQAGKKPVIDLPASGHVAVWFQATDSSGCSAWDSNLGRNYSVDVH